MSRGGAGNGYAYFITNDNNKVEYHSGQGGWGGLCTGGGGGGGRSAFYKCGGGGGGVAVQLPLQHNLAPIKILLCFKLAVEVAEVAEALILKT